MLPFTLRASAPGVPLRVAASYVQWNRSHLALRILVDVVQRMIIGVAQADLGAGRQSKISLSRLLTEIIALDP
jgi:hypothetical protein